MEELLKEIYINAVTNEMSPDEFVDYCKGTLPGIELIRPIPENDLVRESFDEIKLILGLTDEEFKATRNKRDREYVLARHWYMFLLTKVARHSFAKAASTVGKDHATAMNGVKRICNYRHFDKPFQYQFRNVIEKLEKHEEKIFDYGKE